MKVIAGNRECWIWRPYVDGEGFAYAYEADGFDLASYRAVLRGDALAEPFPKITFGRFSSGPMPDALGTPYGCMIVAPKLRALLTREAGAAIQFIPVEVRAPRKAAYVIANVLVRVACLDQQRSKLTRDPDTPDAVESVERLTLRPLPENAPELFHLGELPQLLLVRTALRARMEATSKSLGQFISIESFRLG